MVKKMKLNEFSVNNYRSITNANKIKLQDFTVLVGKNNEGKSNLLKALNVAMNVLMNNSRSHYYSYDKIYDWEKDFPFQLKQRSKGLTSIFSMKSMHSRRCIGMSSFLSTCFNVDTLYRHNTRFIVSSLHIHNG